MKLDARTKLFLFIAGVWITALIVGDTIGGKLVTVAGITITVGLVPFPIVFLLTDLLNEFYGKRVAQYVTFVGFVMALFALVVMWIAVRIPFAPFTQDPSWQGVTESSFNNVFAQSQRILLASITAYLVATLLDIAVFHSLKKATRNRYLWLRATGSTVVSQLIDTVVVQFLAFYGLMPTKTILEIVRNGYLVKLAIAVCLTPLIYAGHALVERSLRLEPVVLGPDGEPIDSAQPVSRAA